MNERHRGHGVLLDAAIPFKVDIATATTHDLIAAVSGKKHYIWRLWLWSNGTVNVTIKDGTTALTGPIPLVAQSNAVFELREPAIPWFITSSGATFAITLSGGVQISGVGLYSTI